jgi:hypothetical protein
MVFAEFTYNSEGKTKRGIIFTWNMASLKFEKEIERKTLEEIPNFMRDYRLTRGIYDTICFCFQEVGATNKVKKALIDNMNKDDYPEVTKNSMRFSFSNYKISILCFTKTRPSTSCGKKCNPSDSFNTFRTKGYAGIVVDNILFLSSHFSIDTSSPDLGLEGRRRNLIQIKRDLSKYPNIILAGDLNFRNIGGDQLTTLLSNPEFDEFFEFGKLRIPTCKVTPCTKKQSTKKIKHISSKSAKSSKSARGTRSAKKPSSKSAKG